MRKRGIERRKSPRISARLSVKLSDEGFDLTTETRNLSRSGLYCRVDRHLPFMSKLSILLMVPVHERTETVIHPIRFQATVVRSESQIMDNGKETHFAALYFDRLRRSDRQKIEDYIRRNLASSSLSPPR